MKHGCPHAWCPPTYVVCPYVVCPCGRPPVVWVPLAEAKLWQVLLQFRRVLAVIGWAVQFCPFHREAKVYDPDARTRWVCLRCVMPWATNLLRSYPAGVRL